MSGYVNQQKIDSTYTEADVLQQLTYRSEKEDYSNPANLIGHSRGTMTMPGTLNELLSHGINASALSVFANNPAAEENRLRKAAQGVTKIEPTFWAPGNDFVAHYVGGYPGYFSFADIGVTFTTPYSVHSSGGAGAIGSHPDNVNPAQLFSYQGLDIAEMNRNGQSNIVNLLGQWQGTSRPRESEAGNIDVMQRILQQSALWQEQLDGRPQLVPQGAPASSPAMEARLQRLQQVREQLQSPQAPSLEPKQEESGP